MSEEATEAGGGMGGEKPPEPAVSKEKLFPLVLAALGVVYGDIGTSPLYAVKLCFGGEHGVLPTEANIFGVLSLIFWSITFVVGIKYLIFIMKADNHGEGGILALLALATNPANRNGGTPPAFILTLVLFGSALLFGDGVITPAISVLSAVEGLNIAAALKQRQILYITSGILVALFVVQRKGTGNIGKIFGQIMLVWFVTLAGLGIAQLIKNPHVLLALNPVYGAKFLLDSGLRGFFVLGGVFLCVTGAEALYADMGHFGRSAIRICWFSLVMPSLILNYFGQGALILSDPATAESPFYSMVPRWGLYPMVALATAATVIASQALISGAFSLNRQAIQLGYCPRLTIVHTSRVREGQIYIPEVNWALAVACLGVVWIFKSSDNLAAAYGVAVTGVMLITSIIYYLVIRRRWGWPRWKARPLIISFLVVDLVFLGANSIKFFQGGYMPLLLALGIFTLMTTWKSGRTRLARHIAAKSVPLDEFLKMVADQKTPRVPGTAVFMTANPHGVPPILAHHWKHDHALHEQVVLLSIISTHAPAVLAKDRLTVKNLGHGFYQVTARYGYMQTPNAQIILQGCALYKLFIDPETVTYFLGRETLIPSASKGMPYWKKVLFALISRNSRSATAYFNIPPDRVVELGMQVEL